MAVSAPARAGLRAPKRTASKFPVSPASARAFCSAHRVRNLTAALSLVDYLTVPTLTPQQVWIDLREKPDAQQCAVGDFFIADGESAFRGPSICEVPRFVFERHPDGSAYVMMGPFMRFERVFTGPEKVIYAWQRRS